MTTAAKQNRAKQKNKKASAEKTGHSRRRILNLRPKNEKRSLDEPFGPFSPPARPQTIFAVGRPHALDKPPKAESAAFTERKKSLAGTTPNTKNEKQTGPISIRVSEASLQADLVAIKNSSIQIQENAASPLAASQKYSRKANRGLGDLAVEAAGSVIGGPLVPVVKALYQARKDPLIQTALGKSKEKISSLWSRGDKNKKDKTEPSAEVEIVPNPQIRSENASEFIHTDSMSVWADKAIVSGSADHISRSEEALGATVQSSPDFPTNTLSSSGTGESKITDAIGLAVGGPFYSAAQELFALKNDPLVHKLSGFFKDKETSKQDKSEAVREETEIVQVTQIVSQTGVKAEDEVINADRLTVNAKKVEFPDLSASAQDASQKRGAGSRPKTPAVSAEREVLPSGRVLPPRDAKGRFVKVEREEPPKPPDPDKDKNRSEQAQEEEKQEQATSLLVQAIKSEARSKPAESSQEKEETPKGESKIIDALGLAVGGPFYSAAKELCALRDDPLIQKAAGLFKGKKTKKQDKAETETDRESSPAEVEVAKTENRPKEGPVAAEKNPEASAPRKGDAPNRAKLPPRDAKGRFVKVEKTDGADTTSDVADSAPDRKKRRQRGRRRAAARRGGKRGGGLIKRLGKTKAGKGISTGANFVKSVGGKIGGLLSKTPLGALGQAAGSATGKVGGILGKANPLKLLGKAGGFLGRLAGKAALPLAAATTAFDMVDGWNSAAEITGKKEKDLTLWDKVKASGAKAAEGLSFGLIPAETFFNKPEESDNAENGARPEEAAGVKRASVQRETSAAISGAEGRELDALMGQNPAAAPATTGVSRALPSPLTAERPSALSGAKTTAGDPAALLSNIALQGDKLTTQKLDVIIAEIRNLHKDLSRRAPSGPSPVRDPFLRETIAETDRLFNTW